MKTIVVDTEFSGFQEDSRLLSVAFFEPESGRHFYAEIEDNVAFVLGRERVTPDLQWYIDMACDVDFFVAEFILPSFNLAIHGMNLREAAEKATQFLESFDEPIRLASDGINWDFSMLEQLFAERWPSCVSRLKGNMLELFNDDGMDVGDDEPTAHHALLDARTLASIYFPQNKPRAPVFNIHTR